MASMRTLKFIAKISKYSGFTKFCYFLNRNKKRVIAYHNVIPDNLWDDSIHLDHSIKESNFLEQLKVIKNKYNINLNVEDKNTITLTFDDGYYNQYEIASKLLDKLNVNGYFFCVESLINEKKTFAIDLIQFWLSYVKTGEYLLKKSNISISIDNDSRRSAWRKVDLQILTGSTTLEEVLIDLNDVYPFEKIIKNNRRLFNLRFSPISRENLNEMKLKGHMIGAHSKNHKRLSMLSEIELEDDINQCKKGIGEIYNTDIFCYPFGSLNDISDNVINVLKKYGFCKAFSYSNSPLVDNEKYNDYFMPRMYLPNDSNKDLVDFILSGGKHMISYRKLLP